MFLLLSEWPKREDSHGKTDCGRSCRDSGYRASERCAEDELWGMQDQGHAGLAKPAPWHILRSCLWCSDKALHGKRRLGAHTRPPQLAASSFIRLSAVFLSETFAFLCLEPRLPRRPPKWPL